MYDTTALWSVEKTAEGVVINTPAATAFDLEADVKLLPAELFGTLGPKLVEANGDTCCGAWLLQMLDHSQQVGLARAYTASNICLDVFVRAGQALVRAAEGPSLSQRSPQHELNNRINNILVNAELIRMLATTQKNKQIEAAAQRIVEECAQTAKLQQPQSTAAVGRVGVVLPALLAAPTDAAKLTLSVCGADVVPTALLQRISHFLNRLVCGSGKALNCCFGTAASEQPTALQLELDWPDAAPIVTAEFARQWRECAHNPAALAGIEPSIKAYQALFNNAKLTMEFHW